MVRQIHDILMVFQSAYKPVAMPSEQAFSFFAQPDNLSVLMPEQITEWEATSEHCRFLIKGMGHVQLRLAEKTPFSMLTYLPDGKMPFGLRLMLAFREKEGHCEVQVIVDADLENPLMAMLAQKPLQHLVNEMEARL